ncbi:hypothetical protein ES332_D01G143200v1 [Gossypium tomentosum]|uniref:AP2/ERF domain-containing protein n=1 Tax=Gossypium tomentosum TaxID=34277 RepID=A0A5D2M8W5_GOSTO|nr:hypothetical protein ES332_D01G143200v1 [Gossypium tomentosum]
MSAYQKLTSSYVRVFSSSPKRKRASICIYEPNKRSRIWLGSYSTPIVRDLNSATARAYDTAVFYLRGPSARLNFPDLILQEDDELRDISPASIRKKATEVDAKVDALHTTSLHHHHASNSSESSNPPRVFSKPDLNKYPETSDED